MKKKIKKTRKNFFRKIGLMCFILMSITLTINQIGAYQSPNLFGEWVSEETGRVILFLEEGQVFLEDKNYTPTYIINKPNEMLYTIEDKTFLMEYTLEGRELYWGVKGQEQELFKRK